jgi:hypothetical protein
LVALSRNCSSGRHGFCIVGLSVQTPHQLVALSRNCSSGRHGFCIVGLSVQTLHQLVALNGACSSGRHGLCIVGLPMKNLNLFRVPKHFGRITGSDDVSMPRRRWSKAGTSCYPMDEPEIAPLPNGDLYQVQSVTRPALRTIQCENGIKALDTAED